MSIRSATAHDWPHIWPFFDEIVRAGETYAFPLDLTIETAKPWWMSDETVVFEEEGVILGSAKMGPNRPGRGAHIGTASFMVSPAASGRGVGRRLAEYVVAWHRDQGFAGIQFNAVVETTPPPYASGRTPASRSSAPCRARSRVRRTDGSACT